MRSMRIMRQGGASLNGNKLRTCFMMLGATVGIAALTIIMARGSGTKKMAMQRVDKFLGPRTIMLLTGKDPGPPDLSVTTLTLSDAQAVREKIRGVESVCPMMWSFSVNLKNETGAETSSMLWGVESIWHQAAQWFPVEGEGITDQDTATQSRVAVIGATIKRELFAGEDPVGRGLYLNKVKMTVKGVLESKGASPHGRDFDKLVVVPLTTAQRRVLNQDHLGGIRITSRDAVLLPQQAQDITRLMRSRHHIAPPREDDFHLNTSQVIAGQIQKMSGTLYLLLVVLAVISLLVGGVVMMNIMLISVAERTREIGLRRALGATASDIFYQFLAEAWVISWLGLIAGGLLGGTICLILARTTSYPVAFSWKPAALAGLLTLLVGTFFGVSPARRASRLSPVEALRA